MNILKMIKNILTGKELLYDGVCEQCGKFYKFTSFEIYCYKGDKCGHCGFIRNNPLKWIYKDLEKYNLSIDQEAGLFMIIEKYPSLFYCYLLAVAKFISKHNLSYSEIFNIKFNENGFEVKIKRNGDIFNLHIKYDN